MTSRSHRVVKCCLVTKWFRSYETRHDMVTYLHQGPDPSSQPHKVVLSSLHRVSTMEAISQRTKGAGQGHLLIEYCIVLAIDALNLAKEAANITPLAKAVFGSVRILLTMIKVRFLLLWSDVPFSEISRIRWPTNLTTLSSGWNALISVECFNRGMNGKKLDGPITRGLSRQDGRLSPSGFEFELFLIARTQRRSPQAPTLGFDDGSQTTAPEGARRNHLFLEHSHRSLESCEGGLQHYTSQGRFSLCRYPPRDGQGAFPRLPRSNIPCSCMTRTRWPTNWTTSSSA